MSDFLTETGPMASASAPYSDPTPVGSSAPVGSQIPVGSPTPEYTPVAPTKIQVSVAVVEQRPDLRDYIVGLLGSGVTPFEHLGQLAERLTGTVPVVVVLGPSCAHDSVLGPLSILLDRFPTLAAVLVAEELDTALLQQALRSGVRDVLALSGEAEALALAIQRLAVTLDRAPRVPTGPAAVTTDPGSSAPAAAAEEVPVPHEPGATGQVITVFSSKGGAGTSMLATSLAVELAERSDGPVCLVDADLQFGDAAVMLKLTPHHTIVDAVSVLDQLDPGLLDSLLITHEPSGLKVLPAPLEPAFADQVGAAEMITIVEVLRSYCSFVLVDTPTYFNDVVLGLVEVSDRLVLLAGMDIPTIKNMKVGLQTLRLLNTPQEKLVLAINRSNSKVKLDIAEVERTLQTKTDILIPSDVSVPQAINKGEPVGHFAPKSGPARAIAQLAELLLPVTAQNTQSKKRRRA